MRDDFLAIASQLHAETTLDFELCKIAVRDAFREIRDRANWSWQVRRGVMSIAAPYSTGQASFVHDSDIVTGTGTTWDSSMIGMQIRSAVGDPFYTVVDVPSSNSLRISPSWAGTTSAAPTSYSIFQAYITPPDDFFAFLAILDRQKGWLLNLNVDQSLLDAYDPRRGSIGVPVLLSPVDYAQTYAGKVSPLVQVLGSGPRPVATGTYSGQNDAVLAIWITSGDVVDVATFRWKKDNGAWSGDIVAASLGNLLPEGIGLSWSTTVTYNTDDVFVSRLTASASPTVPRFELYPYPSSATVLDFQYLAQYGDLDDPNIALPRYLSGHVVKEGAKAIAARIPGTDARPNPYAQIARAETHETRFDTMLMEQLRIDEEVFARSVQYDSGLPYAPLPGPLGGRPLDYDPAWVYPR